MSFEPTAEDEEESVEHTLLVVRDVSVYKIAPRPTSGGYKCGEWLQSDRIWSGRLRVVSCRDRCEIRLEDPGSGKLFAACFVYPGCREASVETVLDSSRYFVLKIEDGRGKHAFIGLGFNERNEAFDFNVALSDHDKYVRRTGTEEEWVREGVEGEDADNHIEIHPVVNYRLKDSNSPVLAVLEFFDKFLDLLEAKIEKYTSESIEGKGKWGTNAKEDSLFLESVYHLSGIMKSLDSFNLGEESSASINRIESVRQRAVSFLEDEFRSSLHKCMPLESDMANNEEKPQSESGDPANNEMEEKETSNTTHSVFS